MASSVASHSCALYLYLPADRMNYKHSIPQLSPVRGTAMLIAAREIPVQLSSGKFKCGKKKNIFPPSFINTVSKISEERHGQI